MASTNVLPPGRYRILYQISPLRNLAGEDDEGSGMTEITFSPFVDVYSFWDLMPMEDEGEYIIANIGSRHRAYVRETRKGAHVYGHIEESTRFVIQKANSVQYRIKAVHNDLFWTVENTHIALKPAASDGGASQLFRFEFS